MPLRLAPFALAMLAGGGCGIVVGFPDRSLSSDEGLSDAGGVSDAFHEDGASSDSGAEDAGAEDAPIPTGCGDGTREGNEECDTTDFGGATCLSTLGPPASGQLRCSPTCKRLVDSCVLDCPKTGGWTEYGRCGSHQHRSDVNGPAQFHVAWDLPLSNQVGSSIAIASDGTLLFGGYEGKLHAVDAATHKETWSFDTQMEVDSSPAIGSDGTVYFGSTNGSVYAVARPTDGSALGKLLWKKTTMSAVVGSPVIGADGTVYIGSRDKRLYAFASHGEQLWVFTAMSEISSSPAIGPDGMVYVLSADARLYALTPGPGGGQLKWTSMVAKTTVASSSSPAVGANQTVYFSTDLPDDHLYAVSTVDGSLQWAYELGSESKASPAIGPDGTIYIGTQTTGMHAVRPDGTTKWKQPLTFWCTSAPAIGADGTVYVSSWTKTGQGVALSAFRPDGTTLWKSMTNPGVMDLTATLTASPTLGPDGILYIASADPAVPPRLYAIGPLSVGASVSRTVREIRCAAGESGAKAVVAWGSRRGSMERSPSRRRPADGELSTVSTSLPVMSPDGAVIWVVSGDAKGKQLRVPGRLGESVSVGKGKGNDLVLDDPSVSRQHLRITRTDAGLEVRDLESTNGTHVGQARVREALVEPGTLLRAGDVELLVGVQLENVVIPPSERDHFGLAVGAGHEMRRIFGVLERIAPTTATVLLTGETGTGKDVLARSIHLHSRRADGPFEVIDCGAVTGSLIESELFGHERGAFTGAVAARAGAFERAAGGTVFLDEIGELALDLQPKLLRVLEAREIRRVGGSKYAPADVRVVAATTRDLASEVARGAFREDLYFRLAVVSLRVPPLRSRTEDIPLLVRRLLPAEGGELDVPPALLAALRSYDWPGNVRELRNVIERAVHFAMASGSSTLQLADFPPRVTTPGAGRPGDEASENFDPSETYREARAHFEADFERRYVAWLLARFDGNLSAAARGARMDRNHLTDLARRHGLDRKRLAGRRVASRWGPGKLLVRREPKARSPHP